MTKNLETADTIVKLVLAICTIVLFFAGLIAGPFATLLVFLSMLVVAIYAARVVHKKYS